MKKILMALMILFFASQAFSQNYYFLVDESETNRYVVQTQNAFENIGVPYVVRLESFNADVQTESVVTIVPKPSWMLVAQNLYTNGLVAVGLPNVWTNMSQNYETIAVAISQAIANQLAVGNINNANTLSTWKGLIKDAYESIMAYIAQYGITDMRNYPYASPYIFSNNVVSSFILYDGKKYSLR